MLQVPQFIKLDVCGGRDPIHIRASMIAYVADKPTPQGTRLLCTIALDSSQCGSPLYILDNQRNYDQLHSIGINGLTCYF